MAKIRPCFEGKYVTPGDTWVEVSLAECEQTLGLHRSDYRCGVDETCYFGDLNEAALSDFQYVVIEVSEIEADHVGDGWRPGKYVIRMTPAEVCDRLGLASKTGGPV